MNSTNAADPSTHAVSPALIFIVPPPIRTPDGTGY